MGFNRRYLPELERLEEMRKSFACDSDFLNKIIGKSDSLIGSLDSMNYLESIKKKLDTRKQPTGEQ